MAWPLTPLTTYVANSLPAIKAADLNSLQSATNTLYNTNTREVWLDTTNSEAVTADWVFSPGPPAIWTSAGGNKYLYISIPNMSYVDGSGTAFTIQTIRCYIHKAGATVASLHYDQLAGFTAWTSPATTDIGNVATAASSGYKTLTLSSLGLTNTDDKFYSLRLISGDNGDIYYGTRLTYFSAAY